MLKKHFQICLSLYTSRVLRSYAVAQEEELKVDDRFSSSLLVALSAAACVFRARRVWQAHITSDRN